MADDLGKHLRRNGQSARTVTAKLRYTDFSIRSRSTSLDVGIDDPERIGELACALLDRGLRDRPGALRLVGVGALGPLGLSASSPGRGVAPAASSASALSSSPFCCAASSAVKPPGWVAFGSAPARAGA